MSSKSCSKYVMTENAFGGWNLFVPTSEGTIKAWCGITYEECVDALYEDGVLNGEEYAECKKGVLNMIAIGDDNDYNSDPKKNVMEILNRLKS